MKDMTIYKVGIFVLVALMTIGVIGLLTPAQTPAPDTLTFPVNLETTPTRYYVASMVDGWDGWVSYGAIWVAPDRSMWIAPDWVVDKHNDAFGDELHIKREGEYIILFRDSLGSHTWTPGVDSGWNVDKKPNLLRVKLR